MTYDTYLVEPYIAEDRALEDVENRAYEIMDGYDRAKEWPGFLAWYAEEEDDEGCINAVKQRDFEAIGGILYAAFDGYLWECALAQARRG